MAANDKSIDYRGVLERLRESEERFQSVFQTAGAAMVCITPDFIIFEFNREAERLFGYRREEVIGCNYLDIFVPKRVQDTFVADNQRVLAGHSLRNFEGVALDRSGRKYSVSWNVDRILDGKGNVIGLIGCGQDISGRKRAEEQLRSSHERFKTVMDSLDSVVYVSDMKTYRLLYVNRHGENIWGPWHNRICWEVLQGKDTGPCEFCTNPLLLDDMGVPRGVHVWEFKNQMNDRWYECRDQAIYWTDGRIVRLEIASDITERKKAESALRENENYLRTIMSTIQTGVMISDCLTQTVVDANPYALDMLGMEKSDVVGSPVFRFISVLENKQAGEVDSELTGEPFILHTANSGKKRIRLSQATTEIQGRKFAVFSFTDISGIVHLLKEQAVNIDLASRLLGLVNGEARRSVELPFGRELFVADMAAPCKAVGGDHFFARHLIDGRRSKTVLSVKDQSGHEVNCVLKSIATDLLHNAILYRHPTLSLGDSLVKLNRKIIDSNLLGKDDFLTAMIAEIQHETLQMWFASCGHPAFLLIRGEEIMMLPGADGEGKNLPLGTFTESSFEVGTLSLEEGDKLLLYTDGLTEMSIPHLGRKISPDELNSIIGRILKEKPGCRVSHIMERLLGIVSEMSREEVIPFIRNTSADDVSILGVEIESRSDYEEEILRTDDLEEIGKDIIRLGAKIASDWRNKGMEQPEMALGVVLEEAVFNAWRHGNKMSKEKAIIVRWRSGNDYHLEIIDEGDGFDPEKISDPTMPDNRLRETGRGIFMMRFFTDTLKWKNGGRHLVATFRNRPNPKKKVSGKSGGLITLWEATDRGGGHNGD